MRKVVIGFDKKGDPYVISASKKIEVVFKKEKKKSIKKRVKTFLYRLRAGE